MIPHPPVTIEIGSLNIRIKGVPPESVAPLVEDVGLLLMERLRLLLSRRDGLGVGGQGTVGHGTVTIHQLDAGVLEGFAPPDTPDARGLIADHIARAIVHEIAGPSTPSGGSRPVSSGNVLSGPPASQSNRYPDRKPSASTLDQPPGRAI